MRTINRKPFVSRNLLMMVGVATLLFAYGAHASLSQTSTILGRDGARKAGDHSTLRSGLIPNSPQLMVIQGQVTKLEGRIATVSTPPNPTCMSGQSCSTVMQIGKKFEVDTSGAVFRAADGNPTKERLKVGQFVIVAGTEVTNSPSPETHILQAKVIAQATASNYAPVPVSPQ